MVEPRDTTEVVLVEPRDTTGQVLTTETKQTENSEETRDDPAPVIGEPTETVGSAAMSGKSSSYSSTPSPMCGDAVNDDSNIGNETDSDLDYDDLDDIACNSDVEDVMVGLDKNDVCLVPSYFQGTILCRGGTPGDPKGYLYSLSLIHI